MGSNGADFTIFLMAAELDTATDDCKQALLIHCLGLEGQRIFHSLPDNGTTYAAVTAALAAYFHPCESLLAHCLMF